MFIRTNYDNEYEAMYRQVDSRLANESRRYLKEYIGDEKHVVVPDGVETIKEKAFFQRKNLEVVELPKNRVYLREGAFFDCPNLHTIIFSGEPPSFDSDCFVQCPKVRFIQPAGFDEIQLVQSRVAYADTVTRDAVAHQDHQSVFEGSFVIVDKVLKEYLGCDEEVFVPDGVEVLARESFSNKDYLTKVWLPPDLHTIEAGAFDHCPRLNSVVAGSRIPSLEESMFTGCSQSIQRLEFDDAKYFTDFNAFQEQKRDAFLANPSIFLMDPDFIIWEDALVYYNGRKRVVYVPEAVKFIAPKAFDDRNIEEVWLPKNITTLCVGAFTKCESLKVVVVPDSFKYVPDAVFDECSRLKLITNHTHASSVSQGGLTRVNCPPEKSIPKIDSRGVVVTEGNETTISEDFLMDFDELVQCRGSKPNIVVPKGIKVIRKNAFSSRVYYLHSVVIPEGVERIEETAFNNKVIDYIELPSTLKVFEGIQNLSIGTIFIHSENPDFALEEGVLLNKDKTVLVYYPKDLTRKEHIHIPKSVRLIQHGELGSNKTIHFHTLPKNFEALDLNNKNNRVIIQSLDHSQVKSYKMALLLMHNMENRSNIDVAFFVVKYLKPVMRELVAQYCRLRKVRRIEPDFMHRADEIRFGSTSGVDSDNLHIDEIATHINEFLEEAKPKLEYYSNAMEFFSAYSKFIKEESKNVLLEIFKASKIPEVTTFIEIYAHIFKRFREKMLEEVVHPTERFVLENYLFDARDLDDKRMDTPMNEIFDVYRKNHTEVNSLHNDVIMKLFKRGIPKVKLKSTGEYASDRVIMYLVSSYIGIPFMDIPIQGQTYYIGRMNKDADTVVKTLNLGTFRAALDELVPLDFDNVEPDFLFLYFRHASEKKVQRFLNFYNKKFGTWASGNRYSKRARRIPVTIEYAMLLSDTLVAVHFALENERIKTYAALRGVHVDSFRAKTLERMGLDTRGKVRYSIAGNNVEVVLKEDMTFAIYNEKKNKFTKSFPKFPEAPEESIASAKAFQQLKKVVKEMNKGQLKELKENFIFGKRWGTVGAWEDLRSKNVIFAMLTKLLVWKCRESEKTRYFIHNGRNTVDVAGEILELDQTSDIHVAHPVEISKEELRAWRRYLREHKLKQPFEQMWEPVTLDEDITERYGGLEISLARLHLLEREGFDVDYKAYQLAQKRAHIGPLNRYISLNFYKSEFYLELYTMNWTNEGDLTGIESVELFVRFGKLRCGDNMRIRNHMIARLDQFFIFDFIEKDDPRLLRGLERFAPSQVESYLEHALEWNSRECVETIMKYKSQHQSDFDEMESCTLD